MECKRVQRLLAARCPATAPGRQSALRVDAVGDIDLLSLGCEAGVGRICTAAGTDPGLDINSGNGYYGGLQFDIQTWIGNGGGAYAPNASLASKAQQIDIANRVYAQRGLSPWGCGWAASS
jgi:hypothetical protein